MDLLPAPVKILVAFTAILVFSFLACQPPNMTSNDRGADLLMVEGESFIRGEGTFLMEDLGEEGTTVSLTDSGHLIYVVHIPETGYYHLEIMSVPEDTIPAIYQVLEMSDKTDTLARPLTDSLICQRSPELTPYTLLVVDGVPLKAGMRKIKLTYQGGKSSLDWIMLRKIDNYEGTIPETKHRMDGSEWKLAWSEEFEGNDLPDSSRWKYLIGFWGWRQDIVSYSTEKEYRNAYLEDGHLVMEARLDDSLGWTGARLSTHHSYRFKFGKLEMRAKFSNAKGIQSSAILWSDQFDADKLNAHCQGLEIIRFANTSGIPTAEGTSTRSIFYCEDRRISEPQHLLSNSGPALSGNEFNDFTFIWDESTCSISINGNQPFTQNFHEFQNQKDFLPPLSIILDLGVTNPSSVPVVDSIPEIPLRMEVDYIRIYEKT